MSYTIADQLQCYLSKIEECKHRGLEFNLSIETFLRIKAQTHCAYSGIEFAYPKEGRRPHGMTLERIDNTKGYIDGNVIPVCHIWNKTRDRYTSKTLEEGKNSTNYELTDKTAILNVLKTEYQHQQLEEMRLLNFVALNAEVDSVVVDRSDKPRIAAKSQDFWTREATLNFRLCKNLKKYRGLVEDADFNAKKRGLTEIPKKQRKMYTAWLTKIHNLEKLIVASNDRLGKFYNNRIRISDGKAASIQLSELQNKMAALKIELDKAQEVVDYLTEKADILNNLKPVLERFENLSESERSLVKEGLPLTTSKALFLRHKIGKALLIKG